MPASKLTRTVALVFIVAREGGMLAGDGGQVGGGRCDRLDAGLLVVGDDRHRVAGLAFSLRRPRP